MSKTSRWWSFPFFALALVAADPGARAAECGEVGAAGVCRDSKTLLWCADGQLQEMVCPVDEVCVADDRFGPGGSGCLATQYTDCGQFTQMGECAGGDRAVVWCEANRVKVRACEPGTACAWIDEDGWFDCVATRPNNATSEPSGPDDNETDVVETPDDDASDGPDVTAGDTGGGPLPSVEKGGAAPTGTAAGGGAGCTGGALPAPWVAVLGLALGLAIRRGRRRAR